MTQESVAKKIEVSAEDKKVMVPLKMERTEHNVADSQPNFLDIIERLASNPNVDVEKIQRIMDMQEQIITREAKRAFNAAMVQAQMAMPIVKKKEKNSQTGTMYAGYDDIVRKCQPIYTKCGFAVTFYQGFGTVEDPIKPGCNRIMADIMHADGYTKTVHADIPAETTGIKGTAMMTQTHATGSSFSYGRSYLIRLIFNIPTGDDDDGNRAGGVIKYISDKEKSTILDMFNSLELNDIQKTSFYKTAGIEKDDFGKIKASDFGPLMVKLRSTEKVKAGKK